MKTLIQKDYLKYLIRRRAEFYHNCEDPTSIMAYNEINNTRSVEFAQAIMTRLSRVLSPQIRQPGPWGEPQATNIIRDAQNDINFARQQEEKQEERVWQRTPSYEPEAYGLFPATVQLHPLLIMIMRIL